MNLGIDISQIVYEGTGVARFVNGLTQSILQYETTQRWTFFFSSLRQTVAPEIKKRINENGHRLVEVKLPPTALSFLWNNLHRLKIEKLTGKLDFFITSDWTEPPSHIKKGTIIHDLVYLKYPETVHELIRNTQRSRMHWVKKESSLIFADSLSTKDDIVKLLEIDPRAISVNYPGVNIKQVAVNQVTKILSKYNLNNKGFLLTVGKIEPRKNIKRLIAAYEKLDMPDIPLVVVGHQGWDEETKKYRQRQHPRVRFLDFVSDLELHALYSSCFIFAYPSLYEGFGFPVVEAMQHSVPVITSNTSSLKEIADGTALLVDPYSIDSIASGLQKVATDGQLRTKLIAFGLEKAKMFTWRTYYKTLLEVISNMLQ